MKVSHKVYKHESYSEIFDPHKAQRNDGDYNRRN